MLGPDPRPRRGHAGLRRRELPGDPLRRHRKARALIALTRELSPSFQDCELTHLEREPIDLARAREQHGAYCETLRKLGCEVRMLPAEPTMPDSVFVADTAIVLDEVAVITRPGAESRRPETPSIKRELANYRSLCEIAEPASIDGGDVIVLGKTIFVGLSSRTNREAIDQLRQLTSYEVIPIPVKGCLHLQTAATPIAGDTLLVNPDYLPQDAFPGYKTIAVHPAEKDAANALLIGDTVVYSEQYPRTIERLSHLKLALVNTSELAKAEAGVTCCSLVFPYG